MPKNTGYKKRKTVKRTSKNKAPAPLSVISVRISDEEKMRIDEIMRSNNIERYADVMHQAIKMVKAPQQAA